MIVGTIQKQVKNNILSLDYFFCHFEDSEKYFLKSKAFHFFRSSHIRKETLQVKRIFLFIKLIS